MNRPTISSVQNPRIKEAARLRDRKHRQLSRRTLIDGARELFLAISAGAKVVEVYFCPELCESAEARSVLARLDELSAEAFAVTPPVFAKLAFGDRLDGVIGVVEIPATRLESWRLPSLPLVAVLEGIEKPGNIGAILRSADAAGVHGVIVTGAGTDLYNPNTIRASLGTLFSLRTVEATAEEALAWLRERGFSIFAARIDAAEFYDRADYQVPTAIVLGSEAHGLSNLWQGPDIRGIKLPMLGLADSLNVSATAAVLFYEVRRQRQPRER